jgi:hypothetical protein
MVKLTVLRLDRTDRADALSRPKPDLKPALVGLVFLLVASLVMRRVLSETRSS